MLFKTPPPDFKKEIEVTGCFVENDGKLLLLKRQPHKANGNTWGMPAGKVDFGETVVQAMSRELREETGLNVLEDQLRYFGEVFVRNAGHDLVYHMFSFSYMAEPVVTINPKEHQQFAWVTPQKAFRMDLIHDLDECIRMFFKL